MSIVSDAHPRSVTIQGRLVMLPAMAKDLVLEVLKQIRDEAKKTNLRLDRLEGRLEDTVEGIGRLEQRQANTEIRLATEIVALAGTVKDLRDTIVEDRELRKAVGEHERRISALEDRTH